MALCALTKDLCKMSEELVPRTAGLHQDSDDLFSLRKGLREEPEDLHQEPKGVSSLAEDICRDSTVLLQEPTILFRWKKGHSVSSKSGASRAKRLSRVSTPLRLEPEDLFVEPERLCGHGLARSATNLVPSIYLVGEGAISSDVTIELASALGGEICPSSSETLARQERISHALAAVELLAQMTAFVWVVDAESLSPAARARWSPPE